MELHKPWNCSLAAGISRTGTRCSLSTHGWDPNWHTPPGLQGAPCTCRRCPRRARRPGVWARPQTAPALPHSATGLRAHATNPKASAGEAAATHVSKGRAALVDSLCAHNNVTWQHVADVHVSAFCSLLTLVQVFAGRKSAVQGSLCGRAVGDVGVPRDPAAVGGAPVHIAEVVVEHVLERGGRADHVAAQRVLHALGLAGRAARVQLRGRAVGF